MRTRKIAGTVIAATAACLVLAGQASAAVSPPSDGWDYTYTTTDSNHGGTLYIEKHGDTVQLCDTYADGLAPRADIWWYVSDSSSDQDGYSMIAPDGNGSCVYDDAAEGGVFDQPEGFEIHWDVYLGPDKTASAAHENYGTFINNA